LSIGTALLALCGLSRPAPADSVAVTPDQQTIVDQIAKSSSGENVRYAAVPTTGRLGGEIKLPISEGKYITVTLRESTIRDDGSISWNGQVKETGERAVFMQWGDALLTGYFAYNGTIYTLENAGGGVQAFKEMDPHKLPGDHPAPTASHQSDTMPTPGDEEAPRTAPPEPNVPPFPDAERKALEAKDITIDVMLLYTSNVAKHYVRDPADLLALAIEETNETFKNSGLGNIHLRLVHTQLIDYDGSAGDQFNHLYAMVDGVGPFKDVKKLRNEKRADIVGLIIDNPNGCGLSTRIGPESDEAFFVAHHACATITMSIAHEIGHILGVRHDRLVDENETPFAYGHGHVNGTKWRDIMSYKEGCGGCPRLPYWSNPRIKYEGDPTGTAAADSARVILELAERVSKFR
jgi:hypothetical protein